MIGKKIIGARKNSGGFLASLEAASAMLLVFVAVLSLSLFTFQESRPRDFFVCSDAAIILQRSNALSEGEAQEELDEMHAISGLCMDVSIGASATYSTCGYSGGDRVSFIFPAWVGHSAKTVQFSCWCDNSRQ